jgi:hypothetical protein
MNKNVRLVAVLTTAWIVALPWLSRLPRGTNWAAQYFPDPGAGLWGMVFFIAFFALPAIPLVIALFRDGQAQPSFRIALTVASVLTILAHFEYDLASDAQAAIWLVVAPVLICGLTWGVEIIAHFIFKWRAGRSSTGT